MTNLGYCLFQNTRIGMEDCLDALRSEKRLSSDEAKAGRWMFDDVLSYCRENKIIELTKEEDNNDGDE